MNESLEKFKRNSRLEHAEVLSESKFFVEKHMVPTDVPMINVALSGSFDGGVFPGVLVLAGPSKHFKTSFALVMAEAYMRKYPDATLLFYDSEFGSPKSYFESFGVPLDRVLHCPVTNLQQFTHDLVGQLDGMEDGRKAIVVVDSIGNLASKKEVEDAVDGKDVKDMSRAERMKSLFRMVTSKLNLNEVPMIAINHVYQEQKPYGKMVVSGGQGNYLAANNVWIIGRRQKKAGLDVTGYDFVINVDKSRYVKEKSKIPISVTWEGGVERWSGLLDVALMGGFVQKPSNGWYEAVNPETDEVLTPNKVREADTLCEGFWKPVFEKTGFKEFVKQHYTIGYRSLVEDAVLEDDLENE